MDGDKAKILTECGDPLSQARLRALSTPHAGDWPWTIHLAACGLGMSNEAVRIPPWTNVLRTISVPVRRDGRLGWTSWTGLQNVDGKLDTPLSTALSGKPSRRRIPLAERN